MWLVIASMVVLIVKNAKGFVAATQTVGGIITSESQFLGGGITR